MNLEGLRTYLMGGGVILHQGLKLIGIDVENDLISNSIDAILGIGAIFFRWQAALTAKKAVQEALYTPVPSSLPKP
jgi:hypothetical protein